MKKIITSIAFFGLNTLAIAQLNSLNWKAISETKIEQTGKRDIIPNAYKTIELNLAHLKSQLANAPLEKNTPSTLSTIFIDLPLPDGKIQKFRVTESPVMDDELQASHPNIKTYNVKGVDDVYASGKLDVTEYGFHAMVISPNGDFFIDPFCKLNTKDYITYYTRNFEKPSEFRIPEIGIEEAINSSQKIASPSAIICAGTNLRTYRIAIGCTGEYARAACASGTNTPTNAQILAKVVTSINRVDGVYEREVSVKLVLVASTTLTLFGDPATDPYTGNNNSSTLINESQTIINGAIGSANYDIGHSFSTGGGGLAGLGVVCNTSQKARGITGSASPVGDPYDIDYVAHEVGHQFSGNHTFNGSLGSCGGNRNASTAVEPGSGVTIMAYAGICSTDNIASNSIPYFHAVSYDEIMAFTNGTSCKVTTTTGNNPPVASAGVAYTIPANTPFFLTGSATDADGDALIYQWEEFDLGATAGSPLAGTKPFFISNTPTISPTRYFPKLSVQQSGLYQTIGGEYLPLTAQTLKFRFTARDNKMGGGGVCSSTMALTVSTVATSFSVTSQNVTGISYVGGTSQQITWAVNNTTATPFNCSQVNIYISVDNGINWILNTANTPNDGDEMITLPTYSVNKPISRVKVESVGNIFFDVNNKFFNITAVTTGVNQNSISNYTIKLYPNPFNNLVKIDINAALINTNEKVFLNVYNILGEKLKTETITLTENYTKTFDFSDFANGTYLIEVTNGTKKTISRLVKL